MKSSSILGCQLLFVPLYTLVEGDSRSAKHVEGTSYSEINATVAQLLHMVQVLEVTSTTSICHWYTAPLSQLFNQLFVNSFLKTFVVGCMDQEL